MQSEKSRSPANRQTQTRSSDCQMEKRDSSLQRMRGGVLCITASNALHCIELPTRPHEVWRSLAIDSTKSWQPLRTSHCPLLCQFTWLSCCHSETLERSYYTADSWLEYWGSRKVKWVDTGGVLSQFHAVIYWAPESDPLFHKCW